MLPPYGAPGPRSLMFDVSVQLTALLRPTLGCKYALVGPFPLALCLALVQIAIVSAAIVCLLLTDLN